MTEHFLCGVDYQHEMAEGMADFYDSVEELKAAGKCWRECGIVKVVLDERGEEVAHEWVVEQLPFS